MHKPAEGATESYFVNVQLNAVEVEILHRLFDLNACAFSFARASSAVADVHVTVLAYSILEKAHRVISVATVLLTVCRDKGLQECLLVALKAAAPTPERSPFDSQQFQAGLADLAETIGKLNEENFLLRTRAARQ